MLAWFKRMFKREQDGIVYPLAPLLKAMRDKDAALLAEVGPMMPSQAVKRWREVYPEDFAETRPHDLLHEAMHKPELINSTI
jgi:hypothetical protein